MLTVSDVNGRVPDANTTICNDNPNVQTVNRAAVLSMQGHKQELHFSHPSRFHKKAYILSINSQPNPAISRFSRKLLRSKL